MARQPGMGVFERSIVLVLEHGDKVGSVGLILNLPSPVLVKDVGVDLPAAKGGLVWARRVRLTHCISTARHLCTPLTVQ